MKKQKKQDKQPRGRPVKNVIEPIDTTPEELARAMFRNAERDRLASRKIKFGK